MIPDDIPGKKGRFFPHKAPYFFPGEKKPFPGKKRGKKGTSFRVMGHYSERKKKRLPLLQMGELEGSFPPREDRVSSGKRDESIMGRVGTTLRKEGKNTTIYS